MESQHDPCPANDFLIPGIEIYPAGTYRFEFFEDERWFRLIDAALSILSCYLRRTLGARSQAAFSPQMRAFKKNRIV
jgi:hypothetical protein